MRAGSLRHRATIQQKTVTQNQYGEEEIVWITFATVWMSERPLRGTEQLEARRMTAERITRLHLRYLAGVRPEMQVVIGSNTYDITDVIDVDGRRRELQLTVRQMI